MTMTVRGPVHSSAACGLPRKPVLATLAGILAGLAICSQAIAKTPTGDFAGFSACPRFTTGVNLCVLTHVSSGEMKVGNLMVPVSKPILMQGGVIQEESSPFAETFVEALGGETLQRAPLPVPGGLTGVLAPEALPQSLRRLYAEAVGDGLRAVTMTIELTHTPGINKSDLLDQEGTALALPVRVKLQNPFLGEKCYVGTPASPVILELTTGVTDPPAPATSIDGTVGPIAQRDDFEYVFINGSLLVDNSFSVPRATGCGGSFSAVLDPVIDAKVGLPSRAGHNAAILNANKVEEATSVGVIASEK